MDIKSIVKSIDISWTKVLAKIVFDREGLYEYMLDKANTAVNMLMKNNADVVESVREKMAAINAHLIRYTDYLPAPWVPDAQSINAILLEIYRVTEDLNVESDEVKSLAEKFQIAYSQFKSED